MLDSVEIGKTTKALLIVKCVAPDNPTLGISALVGAFAHCSIGSLRAAHGSPPGLHSRIDILAQGHGYTHVLAKVVRSYGQNA